MTRAIGGLGSSRVSHTTAINVAATDENYRVIDIADAVVEQFAHASRQTNPMVFDKRSYRVSGAKLAFGSLWHCPAASGA